LTQPGSGIEAGRGLAFHFHIHFRFANVIYFILDDIHREEVTRALEDQAERKLSIELYSADGTRACPKKYAVYTDKKENKIFLLYKEIQMGAVVKSYMTNGLLIYG
jgi:hypothetical protein